MSAFRGDFPLFQVIETLLKDSWNLYQRHVLLGSACLLSCDFQDSVIEQVLFDFGVHLKPSSLRPYYTP